MKVTVNFGSVRVIVPCGKGDLPVKQLMDLAITRYKKATGKSLDSWVTIHNLKLLSDGGILDPDDKLNDVADDREQITAVFDEEISPYLMHNGGDGTSASSVGTESPDIFQNGEIISTTLSKSSYNGSDVEITDGKISAGILPLHVRRGSEPALNQLSPSLLQSNDNCKRWSAAVLASGDSYKQLNSEGEELSEDELPPGEREDGSGEEKSMSYQQYINSWNHDLNRDKRREPLGGPMTSPKCSTDETEDSDCSSSSNTKVIEIMKLKNEDGPLGIRIVPADESPEKNEGVIIQGIEPGGRIDRDGRFSVGDRITEINGLKLSKDSYKNAQEILKDAMKAPELSIHCIKKNSVQTKNDGKNISHVSNLTKPINHLQQKEAKSNNQMECDKDSSSATSILQLHTPTKKLPSTLLHKGTPGHSSIRKVGRRILVHLTKGPEGLGFSITSKDPNNGPPFFIKSILPAGAAVDDGRLKTGDKLIEVNKVDVSNMTQPEVLTLLRKVPYGDIVELVISRQETDLSPSPSLPRELPPEKCEDEVCIAPGKKRDIFTYEVALNDTGSAGLGVSVKGKTSTTATGAVDMGIFIKNIFHGGAAHKDGRLQNNDQLLNVNGISLLGLSNGQAMETLRRAMIQGEGPNVVPNAIILTVARRVPSPTLDNPSDQGDGSCHDRSDSLLSESGDSFYVSNENLSSSNKCNGQTPDTSTSDNSANTVIFMSPTYRKMESNIYEENEDELTASSSNIENSDHNHLSNRFSNTNYVEMYNSNVNSQLNLHTNYNVNTNHQEQFNNEDLSNLENGEIHSNCESSDILKEIGTSLNHKKSFSNPAKIDFTYQSHSNSPEIAPQINESDISSFHDELMNEKFQWERNNHFNRNGFARQSMPEKRVLQSYQRNKYSSPKNIIENGLNDSISYNSPHLLECQSFYPTHTTIREMPVDVGPCESYVKVQPKKPHRTRGSCNSPDCPYHAVPTRRESGSSEGTCNQVGPSLGLFKSSSLESLQTAVHEHQKLCTPLPNNSATRGCNESFRAAVDKSFEAADQVEGPVNQKSENIQNSNVTRNHTRAKTVDGSLTSHAKKSEKSTKKKGIFRGLGSVFRFGKSSKKADKDITNGREHKEKVQQQTKIPAQFEERSQRHFKETVEQQQQMLCVQQYNQSDNRHLSSKPSFTFPRTCNASPIPSQNSLVATSQSRHERMHILRTEHQRKHKQRNGYYPKEDEEELYEQHLKQTIDNRGMMNRPLPPLPHQQGHLERPSQGNSFELSPKSKSLEIYKEMSKPGSRKGFADPNRYSHYMNFQEIQQHLQQFRLHQKLFLNDWSSETQSPYLLENSTHMLSPNKRHYRHTVSSPRSRPNSEFIDFGNAEVSKYALRGISESGSLPRRMFPNSKQRPPIPSAFLTQQKHNENAMNGYAVGSFYHLSSAFGDAYANKKSASGSKV